MTSVSIPFHCRATRAERGEHDDLFFDVLPGSYSVKLVLDDVSRQTRAYMTTNDPHVLPLRPGLELITEPDVWGFTTFVRCEQIPARSVVRIVSMADRPHGQLVVDCGGTLLRIGEDRARRFERALVHLLPLVAGTLTGPTQLGRALGMRASSSRSGRTPGGENA